jgi:hypothetical protein
MNHRTVIECSRIAGLLFAATLLSGCGGGSGDSSTGSPLSPAPSGSPNNTQRVQAATATAQNNSACSAIQPFYWEVGDRSVALASGSVGSAAPTAASTMLIASASKWMFGAYVVERFRPLTDQDITALTMRSGYTHSNIRVAPTPLTVANVPRCTRMAIPMIVSSNPMSASHNGGHFQSMLCQVWGWVQ